MNKVLMLIFAVFLIGCQQTTTEVLSGELYDVTEGKDVLSVNTGGLSSGSARASFDGQYTLRADFSGLPDPENNEFYEGWVVRKGANFNVISTGALEKREGQYVNEYTSAEDLTDHRFYVLTIEPDDGDPAPADHVLEGDMN